MARIKCWAPRRAADDYHLQEIVMKYVRKLFPGKTFRLSVGRTGVDYARLIEVLPDSRDIKGVHMNISYGEPTALIRLHNLLKDALDYVEGDSRRGVLEILKELQQQPPLTAEQIAEQAMEQIQLEPEVPKFCEE